MRAVIATMPATCRRWLTVAVATVAACLACAGVAQATVTTSKVTSPADETLLLWNEVTDPSQTFTVSGTTNGETGDAVDIDCYDSGDDLVTYAGASGSGVPVAPDGTFTAEVPGTVFGGDSCELLAVPHGTRPSPPSGFTGPRVGESEFFTSAIPSGANAGDIYDFGLWDATTTSFDFNGSIGECGPGQNLFDGSPAMNIGPLLLDCAGSLYASRGDFGAQTPDLTRSDIEIDGQNAYGSESAYALNQASPNPSASNAGFPPLTASLDSFDTSTGAAQTTESEALVECSPGGVYNPTEAQCSSFVPSGVSLTRVTQFGGDGPIATVTDTYSSTDGRTHALDLEYETDLYGTAGGWELPGQTSFAAQSTGETAGAPPSAPGTIYAIYDTTQAPSLTNPVAAMTFASPYNAITFDNTLWGDQNSALIDYQRTVPACGSVTIQWTYATEASLAQAQADASAAQTTFAGETPPPQTSCPSPAPGKTPAPTPPVAITGPASHVGAATAQVSGNVTPGGAGVSYYVQYGKTGSYGHQTKAVPLAAGTAAVPVTAKLSALSSLTTYHYRVVATGSAGTSDGADRRFTTLAALKRLTVKVSRHAAHRFSVSGALTLPKGVSKRQGCQGTLTILVKLGAKKLSAHRVNVTRKCTFKGTVSLTAKQLRGHGTLTFTVTFNGNKKLAPLSSTRTVAASVAQAAWSSASYHRIHLRTALSETPYLRPTAR